MALSRSWEGLRGTGRSSEELGEPQRQLEGACGASWGGVCIIYFLGNQILLILTGWLTASILPIILKYVCLPLMFGISIASPYPMLEQNLKMLSSFLLSFECLDYLNLSLVYAFYC